MSEEQLSCLIVGDRVVSIDACLKCPGCSTAIEAWFLVVSRGDLHSQSPTVRLERYVDNRRDAASRIGIGAEDFDDLLERAQLAYEGGLGAGAMVYLRQAFELITRQVASLAGIRITSHKFGPLLQQVDSKFHIIPSAFASDGYKLFSELSEVVHGRSSEEVAMKKYVPCASLVRGVIQNVTSDQEMRQAIKDLGWNVSEVSVQVGGEES